MSQPSPNLPSKDDLERKKLQVEIKNLKRFTSLELLKWITGLVVSAVTLAILYFSGAFEVQNKLIELRKKELIDDSSRLVLTIDSLSKQVEKKNSAIVSFRNNIMSLEKERARLTQTVSGLQIEKLKLDSAVAAQGRALMGAANYNANFLQKMQYNHNMLAGEYKELKTKYDTCQAEAIRLRRLLSN